MPDISVSIGADASELRSQLELVKAELANFDSKIHTLAAGMVESGKAADAGLRTQLSGLSDQSEILKSTLRALDSELKGTRADMDQVATATGRMNTAVTAANSAQIERIRANNLATSAARSQTADITSIIALNTGLAASTNKITAETSKFAETTSRGFSLISNGVRLNRIGMLEMEAAGVNTFQALASGMNPFHVAIMEGSQVVGALVQGGLIPMRSILSALVSPFALTAAGAVAVGAGFAYATIEAIAYRNAIDAMVTSLGQTGQGLSTSRQQLEDWVKDLAYGRQLWSVFGSTSREVIASFNDLPPALQRSRAEIANLAVDFAKSRRLDPGDVAAEWGKSLRTTAGALKLVEDATGELDQPEKQHIENLIKAGNESEAFVRILDVLQARLKDTSGWAAQTEAWRQWNLLGAVTAAGGGVLFGEQPPQPGRTPSAGGGANTDTALRFFTGKGLTSAQAAGIVGTLQQETAGLNPAEVNATGHTGIAQWSTERARAAGITATSTLDQQLEAIWKEFQTTETAAFARIKAATTPEAAAKGMESFERPEGYSPANPAGATIYSGKAAAAARIIYTSTSRADPATADAERVTDKVLAAKQKIAVLDSQIATLSAVPNRNADQQNALDTAIMERMKQRTELEREGDAAKLAVLQKDLLLETNEQKRVEIQKEINTLQATMAGGTDSAQAKRQLADAQAERQLQDDMLRIKIQQLRVDLENNGNLQQKLTIQKQINDLEAQLTHNQEGGAAQRAAADAQAERQTRDKSLQDQMRAADAVARADTSAIQATRANAQMKVDLGQMTAARALEIETNLTQRLAAEEIKRYQAVADGAEKNEQVQLQAYEKIMQVALRAAQTQEQAAKRAADEMKRVADASARPFVQAFDNAGSALERFLENGITRTQTLQDNIRTLATSITTDLFRGAGSILSQKAAEGLGGEPGKGLGDLLGKKAASLVGLGGEAAGATGESAMAAASAAAAANLEIFNAALIQVNALLGVHTASQEVNSAVTGVNSASTAANTIAENVNSTAKTAGAGGSLLGSIPIIGPAISGASSLFGFHEGGIVPSALGGAIIPNTALAGGGQLTITHPQEMVLPAPISEGVQAAIAGGSFGGGGSNVNANLTYAPTMTGQGPFASRAQAESFFRTHGDVMMSHARNFFRNGAR